MTSRELRRQLFGEECSKSFGDRICMNSAGVSPLPLVITDAINFYLKKRNGVGFDQFMLDLYASGKAAFARLLGCSSDEVAYMANTGTAISQAAFGIPLKAGDEIICFDQEYPANAYPWFHAARASGAQLKILPVDENRSALTSQMLEAITPKTKVVAVSWVQFQTGASVDLKAIAKACHDPSRSEPAWLVVDAIQGLGVCPFDMVDLDVDIVCGATHKWLIGPIGVGFIAVRKARLQRVRPLVLGALNFGGWDELANFDREPLPGANRFEPGGTNEIGLVGANVIVNFLMDRGIQTLHQLAIQNADRLRHQLQEKIPDGAWLNPKRDGNSPASPITTFKPAKPEQLDQWISALKKHQVEHAVRANGIRLSPHAWCIDEEIDRTVQVMHQALA